MTLEETTHNAPGIYSNRLTIRLRGDLCPGSGEGFLSGVDSDVCYDRNGIPRIPGRSIKGCLRQAARDIGTDKEMVSLIFGDSGKSDSGLLTVGDATLDVPQGMSVPKDPMDALNLFTYTRAQTKVDPATGTVDDGTLRYTRVVRHYLPSRGDGEQNAGADAGYGEAVFHARLELKDAGSTNEKNSNVEVRTQVSRIARALKNMGLDRNRGLGVVRCSVENDGAWQPVSSAFDVASLTHRTEFTELSGDVERTMVAVSYVVRLDGMVMLPQQNAGRSQAFIPGASVMGFFASRLSASMGKDFNDVFMSGKVRFSPLYPIKDDKRCLPAPAFVVKLKGGKNDGKYWNGLYITSKLDDSQKAWVPKDAANVLELEEGVSFRPSKSGFVGEDWLPASVKTTVSYHHSTGKTTDNEGTLYTQECLCEGQLFGGYVECESSLASNLLCALESGTVYVGRSKSAQYGKCTLVACANDLSGRENNTLVSLEEGAPYAYVLESDVALVDGEHAAYATDTDMLCASITEATSLDLNANDLLLDATSLARRTCGGYNAKWNQKRPQMQVFACGGSIAFVAKAGQTSRQVVTIGSRQAEGFGRVRLVRLDEVRTPALEDQLSHSRPVPQESLEEKCRMAALAYARECDPAFSKLSLSFVGRVSLMVRQAGSLEDLTGRIEGIANEQRRNTVLKLCEDVKGTLDNTAPNGAWDWSLCQQCLTLVFRYAKYNGKLAVEERDGE